MVGWIVLGVSMLLVATVLSRSTVTVPKPHQRLYPDGYMKDEVEALQRRQD